MRFFSEISENKIVWAAITAWFIAQLMKFAIHLIHFKKVDFKIFVGSGGMPSSHAAFVTAMSVGVGMCEGFNSTLFAVCAVFSLIVMYDAQGVRRAAGKQAEVLNILINSTGDSEVKIEEKLIELIGHTPVQVYAGALLGAIIAVLLV